VSLDPAKLASLPDPSAIVEIKRLIPRIPMRDQHRDVWAMMEALKADDDMRGTPIVQKHEISKLDLEMDGCQSENAADVMTGTTTATETGADFDWFLQSLAESGLVPADREPVLTKSATVTATTDEGEAEKRPKLE
jgi:hypothetical protein